MLVSARSSAARLSKKRRTSTSQSPPPSAFHATVFWTTVTPHAIRSARCATISTGRRVLSPKLDDPKPSGTSRRTLAARYASVATMWRRAGDEVSVSMRSLSRGVDDIGPPEQEEVVAGAVHRHHEPAGKVGAT